MMFRLMVRGYLKGAQVFARPVTVDEANLERVLPDLAREHAEAMVAGTLGMIEIEFLDEPDPEQRYFRLGTDPQGMVQPRAINLGGDKERKDATAR
jgi:hypothetical protein